LRVYHVERSFVLHEDAYVEGTHADDVVDGMRQHQGDVWLQGGNCSNLILKVQMGIEINYKSKTIE